MDITDQGAQMEPLLPTVSPAAAVFTFNYTFYTSGLTVGVCVCVWGGGGWVKRLIGV